MAALINYLPFQNFFRSDKPDVPTPPVIKMALLSSELKRKINRVIRNFILENKSITTYLKIDGSKAALFYQVNYHEGSPELSVSVDQRTWLAIKPHLMPKNLKKDLIKAREYLESLNPTASRIEEKAKETMVEKLKQTELEQQKFSQKAKAALTPLTTVSLGAGLGVEQVLGTGHMAAKTLSFATAGYPTSAYFQGKDAIVEGHKAEQIKDTEGIREVAILSIQAISNFVGGVLFLAFKVAKQFLAHEFLINMLSLLMGPFYFLSYSIEIVVQSNKIYKAKDIKEQIDAYIHNSNLTDEQKIIGVLQYLRKFVLVTEKEKCHIETQVRESNLSPSEQDKLIEQRMNDLYEVKMNWLKRRIGTQGTKEFFEEANQVLDALNSPSVKSEEVQKGMQLIQNIQKSCSRQVFLYCVYLVAVIASIIFIGALMLL